MNESVNQDASHKRRNVMLTLSYDGSGYSGWQIQPRVTTIQQCLETAVKKLTGTHSAVLCAGRTDAGVHAVGQVANFRTESTIPAAQMQRGLQSYLPFDIVVVQAADVAMKFHATYSSQNKTYRYVMFDGTICPPFLRSYVTCVRQPLDVSAMQQALPWLLGTHDFRCFETRYPNKSTSVRTIQRIELNRQPCWLPWQTGHQWHCGNLHPSQIRSDEVQSQPFIVFEIQADGFLYNMVRAIVGTLLQIGSGQRPARDMHTVIASLDRKTAGMTAPAEGLYLVNVNYPAHLLQPSDQSGD